MRDVVRAAYLLWCIPDSMRNIPSEFHHDLRTQPGRVWEHVDVKIRTAAATYAIGTAWDGFRPRVPFSDRGCNITFAIVSHGGRRKVP